MASNRHLGRIIALQTLYEQDLRREAGDTEFDIVAVLKRNATRYKGMIDDIKFVQELVAGVSAAAADLDIKLQPIAPEWPIDQIARMDRIVLRIGLYELENEQGVPPKVVINEAVELAKAFGGDNSSKFINGVLGTALRQIQGDDTTSDDATAADEAKPAKKPVAKKTAAKPAKSAKKESSK